MEEVKDKGKDVRDNGKDYKGQKKSQKVHFLIISDSNILYHINSKMSIHKLSQKTQDFGKTW